MDEKSLAFSYFRISFQKLTSIGLALVLLLLSGLQLSQPEQAAASEGQLAASTRAASVTLTFNANGGYFDNGATIYNYGTTSSPGIALTSMESSVSRDGWSFTGWYSQASGGTKYTSSSTFSSGSSRTLYAHWACNLFELTYDTNKGELDEGITMSFSEIANGIAFSDAPKPSAEPVQDGYQFDGWSTTSGIGASALVDTSTVKPSDGKDSLVLYARWTATSFTAVFDANGGCFDTGESSVTSEAVEVSSPLSSAGYPQEAPSRPGFTFNGWWTEKTGGTGVSADMVPTFSVNAPNSITYYAQWIGNQVTVTFDATGGTIDGKDKIEYTVMCGSAIGNVPGTPDREHFVFDGWFDASEGGTIVTKATVCEAPGTIYYAHWTPVTYWVYFTNNFGDSPNPQEVPYGSCATEPTNLDCYSDNMIFSGWFLDSADAKPFSFGEPILEDTYLYAEWRSPECTLRFNSNGGTGKMSDFYCNGSYNNNLPYCTFSRNGYTFYCWSDTPKNTGSSWYEDECFYPSASQDGSIVTLYAIWDADPSYEDEYYDDSDTDWSSEFYSLAARAPKYGATYVSGGIFFDDEEWADTYGEDYYIVGTVVKVTIKGKTYSGRIGSDGMFKIKTPKLANCKIGTKVKFTFTYNGESRSVTKKVKSNSPKISVKTIYRTTTNPIITIRNLHKGDIVKLRIAGKTYKKKVKKNTTKLVWKPKVKSAKAGSKAKITVLNKFKQKLNTKNVKVYYSNAVKVGMTKDQVKLVPGFEHPDGKSSGGAYTYYSYSWNNEYDTVYFHNGKVYKIEVATW